MIESKTWLVILFGAIVAVCTAMLIAFVLHTNRQRQSEEIPYMRQRLKTKLTAPRCARVLPEHLNNSVPIKDGDEPLFMRDLLLSMKADLAIALQGDKENKYTHGISAMHYDIPVCAIVMQTSLVTDENGNKLPHSLEMYNLEVAGFSEEVRINTEATLLCDEGKVEYQQERFDEIFVRFHDRAGKALRLHFSGGESRMVQHLYWTNRGQLPCHKLKAVDFARLILEANRLRPASAK